MLATTIFHLHGRSLIDIELWLGFLCPGNSSPADKQNQQFRTGVFLNSTEDIENRGFPK